MLAADLHQHETKWDRFYRNTKLSVFRSARITFNSECKLIQPW